MSHPKRFPLRALSFAVALAAGGNAFAQAIDINVVAPEKNGRILFQRIAPKEVGGNEQGRVVLRMGLRNTSTEKVNITRVEILGQLASNFLEPVELDPGEQLIFHNERADYPQENENDPKIPKSFPVIIDTPYPSTATVKVYLQGVRTPVSETFPIFTHTNDGGPLNWAARASDLKTNEAWYASSNHLGFSQAHGLDASVVGWVDDGEYFGFHYPDTDGTRHTQSRAYGQPVYAMTDGVVCQALNDQPEWVNYPRVDKDVEPEPIPPSTGVYSSGGNHVLVSTGGEIALYAHLQPHSIPATLLQPGAVIERGQYLGKVGYSGATSGPHLHVHVSQEDPNTPCTGLSIRPRPMQFTALQSLTLNEAAVLAKADDMDPLDWADLTNHSAAHPGSMLYPGTSNFPFDKDATDGKQFLGVWRASSDIELRANVNGWSALVAKRNEMAQTGFRLVELDTYAENGQRRFAAVFRHGTNTQQGLSLLKSWASFETHVDQLEAQGLRLADVTHYHDGVSDNFVGVFLPGTGSQQTINTSSWNAFVGTASSFAGSGLRLADVETYLNGQGVRQYVGVFQPGSGTQDVVRSANWTQFKAAWSDRSGDGLRLMDVETAKVNGINEYIGVFRQGTGLSAMELHNGYQRFFQGAERNNALGLRLVDVHVLP